MTKGSMRGAAVLLALVGVLAMAASGVGLFARGDGSVARGASVRGESFDYATSGIYKWNAQRVVAEGVGWDIVTFFAAGPAALAVALFVARGSFRGGLLAVGLFSYFAYQFLEYAMTWAYNPVFLLYVATYGCALAGLALSASRLGIGSVAERSPKGFPRRSAAALYGLMAIFLALNWLGKILASLDGQAQGLLLGQTTLVVQALDLGIVVPLLVLATVALLRRRPVGYFLASSFGVFSLAMSAAITAMLVSAWIVEGRPEIPPLAVFAAATAAAGAILAKAMASIGH
jgi:hypothetical protein